MSLVPLNRLLSYSFRQIDLASGYGEGMIKADDTLTRYNPDHPLAVGSGQFRRTVSISPFWLISFSDTIKGPMRQMLFVVLLPNGMVVESKVARRLSDANR
jgi:hypothetical protein